MLRSVLLAIACMIIAAPATRASVTPSTTVDVQIGGTYMFSGDFTGGTASAPNDVALFNIVMPFDGSFTLTGAPAGAIRDLTLQLRNGTTNPNVVGPTSALSLSFAGISGSGDFPYGVRVRYNTGFSGAWTGTLMITPLPGASVLLTTALLAIWGLGGRRLGSNLRNSRSTA
jgi:hypothetical protein